MLFMVISISLLSYMSPPGWIYVSKIRGTGDPGNVIKITRDELEEFPSILEAIHLEDTSLGYPVDPVKCSHNEGRKIISHFGQWHFTRGSSYSLLLEIEGQLYSVFIFFIHNPPPMA